MTNYDGNGCNRTSCLSYRCCPIRISYRADLLRRRFEEDGKRKYRSNERVPYTWNESGVIAVHLGMPEPTTVLLCALFAIIGNDWSIFLKFKSGKGVACGVGAFTYICAPATIASFIVWLIVFRWKKIVSLASIAGAPVVPIVIWVLGEPWEYVAFSLAAALIVVVKHKENIERLLRGEEKPIIQGKKESQ